jgi:hypothetical protein
MLPAGGTATLSSNARRSQARPLCDGRRHATSSYPRKEIEMANKSTIRVDGVAAMNGHDRPSGTYRGTPTVTQQAAVVVAEAGA